MVKNETITALAAFTVILIVIALGLAVKRDTQEIRAQEEYIPMYPAGGEGYRVLGAQDLQPTVQGAPKVPGVK